MNENVDYIFSPKKNNNDKSNNRKKRKKIHGYLIMFKRWKTKKEHKSFPYHILFLILVLFLLFLSLINLHNINGIQNKLIHQQLNGTLTVNVDSNDVAQMYKNMPISYSWFTWLALFSSFLSFIAGFILVYRGKKPTVAIISTVVFGAISVFSEPSLKISISPKISIEKFGVFNTPKDTLVLNYDENILNYSKVSTIYPFKEGTYSFQNGDAQIELIKTKQFIKEKLKKNDLKSLLIIGKADKRKLKKYLEDSFETNMNLAYFRAKAIKDSLLSFFHKSKIKFDEGNVILLTSGSDHIEQKVSEEFLQKDRSVTIYALWQKKLILLKHFLSTKQREQK